MGYRHYLYVFDKKDLKGLNTFLTEYKFLQNREDDSSRVSPIDIDKYLKAIELLELGNYSDEGFALCEVPRKVHGYSNVIKKIHTISRNWETGFNILKREDLVWLIEKYKNRTVSYWKQMVGQEEVPSWYEDAQRTVEERCVHYVEDLLCWEKSIANTDEDRPWTLQTSWKYEYEMFNLLHILKKVNWKKQLLLIIGY